MDLIGKKVAFMLCNAIYNIGKITNVEFNDTNELVFDI